MTEIAVCLKKTADNNHMKSLIVIAALAYMVVWNCPKKAVSQTKTTTSVFIMPWVTYGIEVELSAKARANLKALSAQIAKPWSNNPQPLTPSANLQRGNNFKRHSSKFLKGTMNPGINYDIAIQPIWCQVSGIQVIALQAIDLRNRRIVASTHRAVRDKKRIKKPNNQMILPVTNELLQKTRKIVQANNRQPLKVDLKLTNRSVRSRGSYQCLNSVISENLAEDFNLDTSVGNQSLVHLGHHLNLPALAPRPTRIIRLEWKQLKALNGNTGNNLKLTAWWDEGILGTKFLKAKPKDISLQINNNRLVVVGIKNITNQLQDEANNLKAESIPTVVKTYGAWAYLDQGRSWGLRMNDRLVNQQNPSGVKGHVVGFYGAGLKLKSPKGTPVHEGAIVYIRKGQSQLKVGQTFTYDQQTFPTNWPP